MKLESLDQHQLERLIKDVLAEKLKHLGCDETIPARRDPSGVMAVDLPAIHLNGDDRLDTGHPTDHVLTKDVYTLEESPRLGCGLMEMRIPPSNGIWLMMRSIISSTAHSPSSSTAAAPPPTPVNVSISPRTPASFFPSRGLRDFCM